MQSVSKKVLSSPKVIEALSGATIQCPSIAATNDNVFCDLNITSGTDVKLSVSFGDTTSQEIKLLGSFIFNTLSFYSFFWETFLPWKDFDTIPYGTPAPQTMLNAEGAITQPTIFVANSEILRTGYITGIELYAVVAGSIKINVRIKIF